MNAGLFTSNSVEWETPQEFFDTLDAEFGFTLDVCATDDNAKCADFYSPEDDGLSQSWQGVCWMNPPYGRKIGKWVRKAYESSLQGTTVVCLLPARTDTRWWHDYCMQSDDIRFIKGRLYFSNKGRAPFPSVVIVFRPGMAAQEGAGA